MTPRATTEPEIGISEIKPTWKRMLTGDRPTGALHLGLGRPAHAPLPPPTEPERRLLLGDWNEDFLTLSAGQKLVMTYDEAVIGCAPS